jgi:pimeloyl-ACP methyl ester carboxylesterase
VLIGVVPALVLVACGGGSGTVRTTTTRADGAPPAPKLRPRACPDVAGFRCFALTVPLHRRGPGVRDGKALALRVAVQRVASAPRGDFLMLTGGPGQDGLDFAPDVATRLRAAAKGYRLVFVDQRGTGATALRCPALQRQVGTSDLAVPTTAAVTACARSLGRARDAYATADTVADLDALRRALGAKTWVAGGVSYGTFVAERLALAHPGTVSKLVLDSVVPQQGAELLERVPLRAVGRVLGADAAADLTRVVAADPSLGPKLFDALTERSIGVPRLAGVPAVLHAAAGGDRSGLDALLTSAQRGQAGAPAAIYSTGLHAATLCADSPAPWRTPAAPAAARDRALDGLRAGLAPEQTAPFPTSTALAQGLLVTCRAWPPTPAPPAPPDGATIAAPALLLAGDHDLSTPLEWAREQAARMAHPRLVVLAGAGHSVLSRARGTTARDALRRFLAAR